MSTRTSHPASATVPNRSRIDALDVLRGFALCGILLVNIPPIANIGRVVVGEPETSPDIWMQLFADQRFFPIFSLLFGIGFSLQMSSAANRVPHPRLILIRRLLVLLGVGALHFLLWQGDLLTLYALVGLLVLLPSTWLPRRATAGLAAMLIVASLALGGERITLVSGLFLLGSVLVRYQVIARLGQSTRVPLLMGLVLAVAAAPLMWIQVTTDFTDQHFGRVLATAGLLLAGVYICALLVLLRTPIRPVLHTVFAPLGRMALTNYLTATALVLAASVMISGSPQNWSSTRVMSIAAAVFALQWLWSTLWLRRFRYGPLEWLWRWATWARRPTLSR